MSFQITGLDHRDFARYFAMSADELVANNAVRVTATSSPGFPCRVSLADAEVGDNLVLVNFEHQSGASPYRAAHAIFIRERAVQARPAVDETPAVLRIRTLSLRAFSDAAMIVTADLVEGQNLGAALDRMLADPATAYVHIHYAKYGCYAARADRV